ncbi:MAG TPA: hypothetical protein PLV45_10070 [bacterium]|nr:hypothetical protein [bacterium]
MDRINRFLVLAAFLMFFILMTCFNGYSTDDAYISYRYAQNLADGNGLVFNPQQAPVEGYTNFLWTVILSGAAAVLLPLPETASFLSGVFAVALLLLMVLWAHRQREFRKDYLPAIPVMILAASPSLALWSTAGMETVFFTFLLVLGTVFLTIEERQEWIGIMSGLTFALAALTRPEGLLLGGLIIAVSFLESSEWGTRFIAFIIRMIVFLLPPVLHILWRRSYYGQWLPNTFYAKTTSGSELIQHGLGYLGSFAVQGGLILFILIALGLLVRPRIDGLWTILVTTIVYSAYVVWIGGDWMPAHRMFLPILPFLAMGAGAFIIKSMDVSPRFAATFASCVVIYMLVAGITAQAPFMAHSLFAQKVLGDEPPVDVLKELGLHLREVSTADETVAVIPAGKVPYFSGLRAIDMRGLCDAHIAHQPVAVEQNHQIVGHLKRDPEYVLSKKPDFIVLTGARLKKDAIKPGMLTPENAPVMDKWTITQMPEFKRNYKEVVVPLPRGSKELVYYKRLMEPKPDLLMPSNPVDPEPPATTAGEASPRTL